MNNKIVVGVVFGLILGAIDGASAWFYPSVRPAIVGIIIGSSVKSMMVGVLAGWYALKVDSVPKGIILGSVLGLLFAYAVAAMQKDNYLEIMAPGFVVGAIIGLLTQRMGTPVAVARK